MADNEITKLYHNFPTLKSAATKSRRAEIDVQEIEHIKTSNI